MTCDIVWHRKPPVDIIANAMEAWVPNLNIGRLFQNVSMSVNMFGMNMCAFPCDNPPTGPVQRTEISQECVSSHHERRIRELEDKIQTLLRNHGDRVSELESSGARLKASCKTADAASQTDPEPTEEYDAPTAAADVKKDAVCDALGNNSEAEDVTVKDHTVVLQHTKPKKKRKPRKNRSRGARSRAKAAAALALSEVETATSPPPTKDSTFPVTKATATSALEEAEVAALVLPTNDSPVPVAEAAGLILPTNDSPVPVAEAAGLVLPTNDSPVPVAEAAGLVLLTNDSPVPVVEAAVLILPTDGSPAPVVGNAASTRLTNSIPVSVTEVIHKSAVDASPATPAEDRRCIISPVKDHSFDHRLQPGGVNMKNLFLWFQVTKLDLRKQHV
jgi:hypothetical protein